MMMMMMFLLVFMCISLSVVTRMLSMSFSPVHCYMCLLFGIFFGFMFVISEVGLAGITFRYRGNLGGYRYFRSTACRQNYMGFMMRDFCACVWQCFHIGIKGLRNS